MTIDKTRCVDCGSTDTIYRDIFGKPVECDSNLCYKCLSQRVIISRLPDDREGLR